MAISADEWRTKDDAEIITLVGQGLGTGGGTAGLAEMIRRLTVSNGKLRVALRDFQAASDQASRRLIWLTRALVALTVVLAVSSTVVLIVNG